MTCPGPVVDVSPPTTQARRAAEAIATSLHEAVAARGAASLAVSGGSSAAPLFATLADLFQVDERVAPPGTPTATSTAPACWMTSEHLGRGDGLRQSRPEGGS